MKTYERDAVSVLISAIGDIKHASAGYYALYFHLSRLGEQYKSDYQIRIAYNILNDLLKPEQGAIFLFDNADVAILYFGEDRPLLEKSVFQLRYLFMDDALAYSEDGYENPDFCAFYDLAFQWKAFYEFCVSRLKRAGPEPAPSAGPVPAGARFADAPSKKRLLLTSAHLEEVAEFVRTQDISACFRMQPICFDAGPDAPPKPIYDEFYVDISDLESQLPLPVDLRSNKILFSYLTEFLDRNVLAFLAEEHYAQGGDVRPLSLNMNCRSLMTDVFARFDASVPSRLKKRIIIEIHVSDVFSDPGAYMVTKDLLQHKGYRICIDGTDAFTLPQLRRGLLGFDLAKLAWHPDSRHLPEHVASALEQAVADCGANRIVLCRCGQDKGLEYGRSLGIQLFQGRYIDALLPGAGA
jgi:hypothetical protein